MVFSHSFLLQHLIFICLELNIPSSLQHLGTEFIPVRLSGGDSGLSHVIVVGKLVIKTSLSVRYLLLQMLVPPLLLVTSRDDAQDKSIVIQKQYLLCAGRTKTIAQHR